MLITALYQKVSMKIFALLLSLFYAANGAAAAPSTEAPIKSEQANMSFVAIADSQVSTYLFSRYKTFVSAAQDIVNNAGSFDALCFVGDIAENGLAEEFQLVYDGIKDADCRFITATGNHDIRIRSYKQSSKRFADFTNALNGDEAMEKMHYTQVVNGYKFIVLGSDRTEFEEAYLSPEQLAWLDSELAAESGSGKPVFVLCHQPLAYTHGLPDVWNSPIESAGSVGAQSDELRAILGKYENVFLISGHEHTGFGQYTYQEIDGFYSINLPSFGITNKDGEYNDPGTGYVVEVYDDTVVFKARDFGKGIWLPDYDLALPIK